METRNYNFFFFWELVKHENQGVKQTIGRLPIVDCPPPIVLTLRLRLFLRNHTLARYPTTLQGSATCKFSRVSNR